MSELKRGSRSPWGSIQGVEEIIPGMVNVDTPGHGGIHLDPPLQQRMPKALRNTWAGGPWYEEDCDWCKPFVVFEAEILASETTHPRNKKCIEQKHHVNLLRDNFPDAYQVSPGGKTRTNGIRTTRQTGKPSAQPVLTITG